MAELSSHQCSRSLLGDLFSGYLQGRRIQEIAGLLVRSQQRLDLLAQRLIAGAGFVEESRMQSWVAFPRGVIQPLDLLPAFRLHSDSLRLSSRWSQARARFHSRITVRGEVCKTSAVSSTFKPPKERSSTSRLVG